MVTSVDAGLGEGSRVSAQRSAKDIIPVRRCRLGGGAGALGRGSGAFIQGNQVADLGLLRLALLSHFARP